MEKARRGFYHTSKSWYGESSLKGRKYYDEIMFGIYIVNDGTKGEMSMRWYELPKYPLTAKLEVFEDAFKVLYQFKDVIKELSIYDSQDIQPLEFIKLLKDCGFKDLTERKEKR